MMVAQAMSRSLPGSEVQPPGAREAGRGRTGDGRFRGREDGMKAGGGELPPPAQ